MAKRNAAKALVALLIVTVTGIGLLWTKQSTMLAGNAPATTRSISRIDMGITYVPVTPKTAGLYGLDIESGALVTGVTGGSPAESSGLRPGDVILSFNGVLIREGVSLVRLIIACTAGHGVTAHEVRLVTWIDGCIHSLRLTHGARHVK